MEELMKKLRELDPEIADQVQAEITARNDEAKNSRQKKKETNELLKQIKDALGVEKVEEVVEKANGSSAEIKALTEKLNNISKELENERNEKISTKKESLIVSKLNDFKVKKNFDFMKDALQNMSNFGESGELIVGESTIDDYLQKMIDNDETIIGKVKETQTKEVSDLYTKEELDNLTDEEYAKNEEKVNRSLQAL